jgi:hypothetical protein
MKANLVSNAYSRIRWAYLLWVPLNAKAKLAGLTEVPWCKFWTSKEREAVEK